MSFKRKKSYLLSDYLYMQLMRGGSLDGCIAYENIKAFVAAWELEHGAQSFA